MLAPERSTLNSGATSNESNAHVDFEQRKVSLETRGAIHSTKISGNFGPKLNGSVRSNRKGFEKTGPPFEVVLFSRSDRLEFWLNGSRPRFTLSAKLMLPWYLQGMSSQRFATKSDNF